MVSIPTSCKGWVYLCIVADTNSWNNVKRFSTPEPGSGDRLGCPVSNIVIMRDHMDIVLFGETRTTMIERHWWGHSQYWDAPGLSFKNLPKTWFDANGEPINVSEMVMLMSSLYATLYLDAA
jgi:hypothetical protein